MNAVIRSAQAVDRLADTLRGVVAKHALEVTWAEWKPKRSDEQNRYLFGACYPPIAAAKGYAVEEIHEWMCGRHFGWVDRPCPKTPRNPDGVCSVPFRTTTRDETGKRNVLKKMQFADFIGTVQQVAAQCGVFIPDPEDVR